MNGSGYRIERTNFGQKYEMDEKNESHLVLTPKDYRTNRILNGKPYHKARLNGTKSIERKSQLDKN
ncbi:hypothetical protein DLM75_23215 [Leptospira stimsonii]|uniref:Uncharacterized protein n=1 Tax=Leptospira stimsonii TaxID=2202203 RepID=A0A396YSJ4_9LEPT|nr:hypothetical protein DLM75_23215 [Leptospira stimsonii]